MWLHWQSSNSWQVDAAVLPTNVSIPGFFLLSFCVLLISDLSSRSSPVPVLSSESPPLLFSVLTCFFFFQFWLVGLLPALLSPCSANLSPLLGHFSPSQGHSPPSKSFPPPQGWFPPPSRSFPPLKDRFFEILLIFCLCRHPTFPPFSVLSRSESPSLTFFTDCLLFFQVAFLLHPNQARPPLAPTLAVFFFGSDPPERPSQPAFIPIPIPWNDRYHHPLEQVSTSLACFLPVSWLLAFLPYNCHRCRCSQYHIGWGIPLVSAHTHLVSPCNVQLQTTPHMSWSSLTWASVTHGLCVFVRTATSTYG